MATNSPQINPIDIPVDKFTRLEQEIRSFFDKIIQSVTIKREELLQQLNDMKLVYLNEEELRKKQARELEKLVAHMIKVSVHQNNNIILMDENIIKTKEELVKVEQPSPAPIILFSTKDLQSLLQQLESVATIQNVSKLYSDKLEPVKSIGNEGNKRDLNEPRGIRIDEEEKIYVCDYNNSRIQVFSKDGDFLTEFGKGQVIRPHDIAVDDNWAFVSDWRLGSILKFQKSNFKLVKKSVEVDLKSPNGITAEDEVLVADHDNNRIVVLNLDLKFTGEVGKEILHFPCDVKTHSGKIFAVDMNTLHNVHVFSKSGDLLHSMISVRHDTWGMFMCFDQFSNIIISDCNHKSIQIFTLEGQFIHIINCEGFPTGIAVTSDNTLVCSISYSVKFF